MTLNYRLQGLGCAVCAASIERKISEMEQIQSVSLNFAAATITINTHLTDREQVRGMIESISRTVEPDISILSDEDAKTIQRTAAWDDLPKMKIIRLLIAALLVVVGFLMSDGAFSRTALFLTAYGVAGYDVLWRALRNIQAGSWFDENFLMAIATVGAIIIREYPEAAAVMVFYQAGEILQELAVNRSRRSITALMGIRPDQATLLTVVGQITVAPQEVEIGSRILVHPGERIPLDGTILEGESAIDTSALTGESLPRFVVPGDNVLSGCVNQSGLLTVRVDKVFGESTVARILDLVQNATAKKAAAERFITRFSKIYTPTVVALAALIAFLPSLFTGFNMCQTWFHRGLIFLVISCPCALVISIPLGFFAGIGKASKQGILIKGSNYLEALTRVKTVALDKTGTITEGFFSVSELHPQPHVLPEKLLELAAYAEANTSHPIGRSILKAYGKPMDLSRLSEIKEFSGKGITVLLDGKKLIVGNLSLLKAEKIHVPITLNAKTQIHVALGNQYFGRITLEDRVKPDSEKAIQALKKVGVEQIVMLTGDQTAIANEIGASVNIPLVKAELLPDQKVEEVENLLRFEECKNKMQNRRGFVAFVGDGINDAPVLARADIGIAMGKLGADAAIEAADIVILTDELSRVPTAIQIAQKTSRIVKQNIILAIGIKVLVLSLGAVGMTGLWEAVFADVGVMLLAVFNAMRVLR